MSVLKFALACITSCLSLVVLLVAMAQTARTVEGASVVASSPPVVRMDLAGGEIHASVPVTTPVDTATPSETTTPTATFILTDTPTLIPTNTSTPAATHSPTPCPLRWLVQPSANAAATENRLVGMSAVSANDVWAVGTSGTAGTLMEHWDGAQWSAVGEAGSGGVYDGLHAVAALSANDAWAVGSDFFSSGQVYTLIEHWNGIQWSRVSGTNLPSNSPDTVQDSLNGVTAVSANDVWAVGSRLPGSNFPPLIMHWDGANWSIVPAPSTGNLYGVAAVSADDVWAVGLYWDYVGGGHGTLVMHWDGTQWSIVPSPGSGFLYGVTAVSANDVWAVGDTDGATLTEHWDGAQWSIARSPNLASGNSHLTSVAAVSANDVWAVGYSGDLSGATQTLIEHWDGMQWSIVPSPNQPISVNVLSGVTRVSANDLWAAGFSQDDSGSTTLTEHYSTNCLTWFTDVPEDSTFYPFVSCLLRRDLIGGYPDQTFRPNSSVTRGQLSKIVSNAAGFGDPQTTQLFVDVPVSSTFGVYIGRLASRDYISGYPCGGPGEPCIPPDNLPYFRTNNKATRGQISKIVSNAAGFGDDPSGQQFEDVMPGSTYYTYTFRLATRSVMSGYPCGGSAEPCIPPDNLPYFRPNNDATRGQTSKIVSNTFFPNCQPPDRAKR